MSRWSPSLLHTLAACSLLLLVLSSPRLTAREAGEDETDSPLQPFVDMLAQLHTEAQRLEDLLAIQRLQRAYGYYIDKGYWHEAADLFSSSGSLEVGMDGVYLGRDRVREMLLRYGKGKADSGPGLAFGVLNRHLQLQGLITLGGDGRTAQARWRNLSLLGEYLKGAWWGDAVLENTYRKENGVWKIQSLRLYPNFVAPYREGWALLPEAAADWRSEAARELPPDAPPSHDYRPFPQLHTPPFHYREAAPAQIRWSQRVAALPATTGEQLKLQQALLQQARDLDRLAAERAIEQLQARYGYYLDKGLWDAAAALFSEQASYEYGQGGVYVGRPRIRAALGLLGPQGLEPGMLNNHLMLQPVITVAEDGLSAQGRWRGEVQLARGGKAVRGSGTYENHYVLEDGVWKLARLQYHVSYWADYNLPWQEATLELPGPSQVLPPDLPPSSVYAAYPASRLVPFHYPHPVTGNAVTPGALP